MLIMIPSFLHSWPYHRVCNKSKTMGAASGAGTLYPSGVPEFIPVYNGVCVV